MMKKLIIGLVAVGAVLAVRPVVRCRAHKMREHCDQMAATCTEKLAQLGAGDRETEVPEHSETTAAAAADRSEALSTA